MRTPQELLEQVRIVAVVGCSTDPSKDAHTQPADMQSAGYTIVPVHPSAEQILGVRAYRALAEIPFEVDCVNVFRPSAEVAGVVRQAIDIGAPAVWVQLDLRSAEGRALAEDAGIDYVEDLCMGAERRRLGITVARPTA